MLVVIYLHKSWIRWTLPVSDFVRVKSVINDAVCYVLRKQPRNRRILVSHSEGIGSLIYAVRLDPAAWTNLDPP